MAVAYRTKMTISTQPIRDTGLMLKSDHFNELTPKAQIRYHIKKPYVSNDRRLSFHHSIILLYILSELYLFISMLFSLFILLRREKKPIDIEKPLMCGAFVDPSKITQYKEDDYILPEVPPLTWFIKNSKVTIRQYESNESAHYALMCAHNKTLHCESYI